MQLVLPLAALQCLSSQQSEVVSPGMRVLVLERATGLWLPAEATNVRVPEQHIQANFHPQHFMRDRLVLGVFRLLYIAIYCHRRHLLISSHLTPSIHVFHMCRSDVGGICLSVTLLASAWAVQVYQQRSLQHQHGLQ